MFAIVVTGNRQFKVRLGDVIQAPLMQKQKPKDQVPLKVLALMENKTPLLFEKSDLKEATVTATVIRHGLGKKLLVFKKKRRKGYRRTKGFRTAFTELKVSEIKLPSGKTLKASLPAPSKTKKPQMADKTKVTGKQSPISKDTSLETQTAQVASPKDNTKTTAKPDSSSKDMSSKPKKDSKKKHTGKAATQVSRKKSPSDTKTTKKSLKKNQK